MSPDEKLKQFFSRYPVSLHKEGVTILKDSEQPTFLIYLESGTVQQFIYTKNGGQITVHFFKPKSFFPLFWAINDIPNKFNYKTVTETQVRNIPKEDFLEFIKSDSEILFGVISRLLFALDGMTARIEYLTTANAQERVIGIMFFLAKHFGEVNGKSVKIAHKFTHQDLANLAGLTRETISREIEELSNLGVLKIDGHTITLCDTTKLNVI